MGFHLDALRDVATREFADLVSDAGVREDVEQELALVTVAAVKIARERLAWLRYELGLSVERPRFAKPIATPERRPRRGPRPSPEGPDGAEISAGFAADLEAAMDVDRVAA